MKLIEKHTNYLKIEINFWKGYDVKKLAEHPTDGSKGYMIVFVETSDLKEALEKDNIKKFENSYLAIYEIPNGYNEWDKLIRKFKVKFNQKQKPYIAVNGII